MIAWLCNTVATMATGLLQLAGVDAVREGCCIVYRGRCMVVASECSGIRSLSAITVTMLLAGLLWRYGVGRIVGLVAVGAVMAVASNVLRVATCVVCPAVHDLSGYVAFGAALGATLFVDGLGGRTAHMDSDGWFRSDSMSIAKFPHLSLQGIRFSLVGLVALLATALLSGCSTIRTLPGIGAAMVPDWDVATLASCWSGANAGQRNMNILSPGMSDGKFRDRVAWQEKRGANTVHLFLANKADGEYAGYSIYGDGWDWTIDAATCKTFRERIAYCRGRGLAVVLWLFADDGSDWNRAAAKDFPRYLSDLKNEGLLTYASTVVVGLELDEYYSANQVAALVAATRAVYSGKVGVHQTSGRMDFAPLADIIFYQVNPGRSASWIESEARRVRAAVGKPVNFFELSRHEDRALSEAALRGGAFAVGNW